MPDHSSMPSDAAIHSSQLPSLHAHEAQLDSARYSVALCAQVFGEVLLHLRRRLKGHGIQMPVEFRQQENPMPW
jgi:hypothetical protein